MLCMEFYQSKRIVCESPGERFLKFPNFSLGALSFPKRNDEFKCLFKHAVFKTSEPAENWRESWHTSGRPIGLWELIQSRKFIRTASEIKANNFNNSMDFQMVPSTIELAK